MLVEQVSLSFTSTATRGEDSLQVINNRPLCISHQFADKVGAETARVRIRTPEVACDGHTRVNYTTRDRVETQVRGNRRRCPDPNKTKCMVREMGLESLVGI